MAMSFPLGLVMVVMVRHAGVSLFHGGENSLMVLLWHGGAVLLLSLACLLAGGKLFSWIGHASNNGAKGAH